MRVINEEKGITLIALVITIIVLLILAGISISMLSGDNGILRQASNAKQDTEDKATLERVQLATISAMIEGKGKVEKNILNRELNKNGFEVTDKNLTGNGPFYFTDKINNATYEVSTNGNVTHVTKKSTARIGIFSDAYNYDNKPLLECLEKADLEGLRIEGSQLKFSVDFRSRNAGICS